MEGGARLHLLRQCEAVVADPNLSDWMCRSVAKPLLRIGDGGGALPDGRSFVEYRINELEIGVDGVCDVRRPALHTGVDRATNRGGPPARTHAELLPE